MLFYNTYYNNQVVSLHLAVLWVLVDIMYIRRRGKHHHSLTSDKLTLKLELLNEEDSQAVAVIRQSDVVGHILREISRHDFFWFIKVGGTTQVKLHSTKLYLSPIED